MKSKLPTLILSSLALGASFASAQITLTALGGGTEGVTTDTTALAFDSSGNAIDPNITAFSDYTVTGSTTQVAAFSGTFNFTISGFNSVNTTAGATYGTGTAANIDRAGSGPFGIRGGSNGLESGEGMSFGIDASGLSASLGLQLTGIKVLFAGGAEEGIVVDRGNTTQSVSWGFAGSGTDFAGNDPFVDLTSLNLIVIGGTSNSDLASFFASYAGPDTGVRIESFTLAVVPEPSTSAMLAGRAVLGFVMVRRRRRRA